MRLTEVEIENLCQHEHLRFELSPGLNAIIGSNGSGKSNALKMAYAALTNDFRRNPGEKADNIRQLAGAREPAFVTVKFEHGGQQYAVTRDVRRGKQSLRLPDGTEIAKDGEINSRISIVLGVTPEIISEYVFVDQWHIFDFLSSTVTERAKAFQRLFGTAEAEKAWAAIGEVATGIQVSDIASELDATVGRHQQLLDEVQTKTAGLHVYADLPERQPADDDDRRAVRDYHRRMQLDRDITDAENKAAAIKVEAATLASEHHGFELDRVALSKAVPGGETQAHQARSAIANWKTLKSVQQNRARLENQLEKANREVVLHQKPIRTGMYISDLDAVAHERHAFLASEIRRAEQFVASLDPATGISECPTCRTPVANLADTIREAREAIPVMKKEYDDLQSRIAYSRLLDSAEATYSQWHQSWNQQVTQIKTQLEELTTIPRPELDEAALSKVVTDHTELVKALADTEREISKITTESAVLETRRKYEQDRITRTINERSALMVVDPASLPQIEDRIAKKTQAFQDRARLRGELDATVRQRDQAQSDIDRLTIKKTEAARAAAWSKHLMEVRNVLHRDNLPRLVAQHYLNTLQIDTNEFLGAFEAPFRVETAEDLSFRALYNDGRDQAAGRLSGGEKVVLAIAFRLAVNLTFAQDVGMLCLDEPTVGLDEHNLGCLETALHRLKELSRSRGLQVILVTHERGLGHLFDKVIDLSVVARSHDDQIRD